MSNPFESASAWETSTDVYLGIGNHRVKIELAEDSSSKGGKPQIKLQFGNEQGTKLDWCNYNGEFLDRIAALYDCAGVDRPKEGEFDPADNCRLTKQCIERLIGHEIGIVIREEPDQEGKPRARVKGYVRADQITDQQPATQSTGAAVSQPKDKGDDVPFLRDGFALDFDLWHGHANR